MISQVDEQVKKKDLQQYQCDSRKVLILLTKKMHR